MPLTNMKRAKRDNDSDEMAMEEPDYPWGLRVHLEDESLDKLDMDDLPAVGSKMTMMTTVEVTSVSQHEDSSDDGERRNVELQITDMELTDAKPRDASKVLYGGDE